MTSLSDRAQYPSLEDCVYLNQASLGLIGQPAVLAMHRYLDEVGRHGNLYMSDEDEVSFFSSLRESAATLMRCRQEQLAILSSAGEMLSQLPYLFEPEPGSRIVLVSSDFPAITRPWIAYAQTNRLDIRFVDERQDENLTDLLVQQINEKTSVVAVSYVQFSTGTLSDIRRLREATRQVGARLAVDVTQAAGAIPVDTAGWDADVVVCSGYKWLGGHGGVGLAALSEELLDRTPPAPGWMGAPNPFDMQATKLPLADSAQRYTQSTMSYVSMTGLAVAIEALLALNIEKIATHAGRLSALLMEELRESGWMPYRQGEDERVSPHIVALTHPQDVVNDAVDALRDAKIICGSRNGRIRVAIAHYNNAEDIRSLVRTLRRVS